MFSDMSVQGEGSPSSLLRRPVSEEQAPPPLERAQASYSPRCQRFRLEEGRKYDRQYAGIYAARLAQMRPALAERARRAWGEGVPVRTLCDLRRGERCCVVGTLFKRMELQPSVLKEEEEERGLLRRPPRRSKYVSDTDRLLLEDERQRIALKGNVDKHRCVTGSVIAVYGADENGDGTFTVEDYRAADLPPQTPIPSSSSSPRGIDRFVLLASGLGVGHNHGHNGKLALQLLVDTVTGQLGGRGEQSTAAAIVRVLLAGNLISHDGSRGDEEEEAAAASKPRYLSKKTQAGSVGAMRQLDELLLQLVTSVPVDVMPGRHDPTDYTLPQQPLHRLMLPRSSVYPTLRLVSNPYQAAIGGVTFLGTSGQNVSDIRRCSSLDDPLDILESTLRLRHVAPTAPDTLACYPFHRTDPFVVDECPHVYFSGNAPSFRSRAVRGPDGQEVLLVAVPEFRSTQTACLVNLRTLHCEPISFSAFSDDA